MPGGDVQHGGRQRAAVLVTRHDEIVHDERREEQQEEDARQREPVHLPATAGSTRSRGARPAGAAQTMLCASLRIPLFQPGPQRRLLALSAEASPLPGRATPRVPYRELQGAGWTRGHPQKAQSPEAFCHSQGQRLPGSGRGGCSPTPKSPRSLAQGEQRQGQPVLVSVSLPLQFLTL